jgi:hypothetical protein
VTRWPIATAALRDDPSATTDRPVFWSSSRHGLDKGVVQKVSTTKRYARKANLHGSRRFNLPTARWQSGPIIDAAFAGGRGSTARMGCDGEAIADLGPDINDAAARPSGAAVHGLKAVGDPGPPSVTLRMACPPISFVRDGSPEACCVYWHLF